MPLASSLTTRCWTSISDGVVREVAFFHKRSRTLLVTDSVLSVPEDPPAIVNPYPLLFHADDAFEIVEDNPASRRKGWQRISLFAFTCGALEMIELGQASRCPQSAGSLKAYFGLFPFRWKDNWKQSFDALRGVDVCLAPFCRRSFLTRHRGNP